MNQRPALAEARRKLFDARDKRVHPGRDDESSLLERLDVATFAEAARALDRDDGSRALAAADSLPSATPNSSWAS